MTNYSRAGIFSMYQSLVGGTDGALSSISSLKGATAEYSWFWNHTHYPLLLLPASHVRRAKRLSFTVKVCLLINFFQGSHVQVSGFVLLTITGNLRAMTFLKEQWDLNINLRERDCFLKSRVELRLPIVYLRQSIV